MDITKAFRSRNGLSLKDRVGITQGEDDPSSVGEVAPIGSLLLRKPASGDGEGWLKRDSGDTDWDKILTSKLGFDTLQVGFNGSKAVLKTGEEVDFVVPYDCTLVAVRAYAKQTGSLQIDAWKDNYTNFPPTNADSITASTPITITSSNKSEDTTLTSWITNWTKEEIVRLHIDSCSGIKEVRIVFVIQAANQSDIYDTLPQVVIEGGKFPIINGTEIDAEVPFNCNLVGYVILADVSGSIQIDVWKDSYANFPPTDADTITGGNEIIISSAIKNRDVTLTSWITSLSKGELLRYHVDSCSTIERVTIIPLVERT